MQGSNPASRKPQIFSPRECADCPGSLTPTGSRQTRCETCQIAQDVIAVSAARARGLARRKEARAEARSEWPTCSVEGCGARLRKSNTIGRCQDHRHIGEHMGMCAAEGCATKIRSDNRTGFCEAHKFPTARAPERICGAPDCGLKLRIDNRTGFCVAHAKRSPLTRATTERYNARLREETARRPDERPFCSIEGCQNRLRSDNGTGRCIEHHYLPRDMPECAIEGCTAKLIASNKIGRCLKHRAGHWAADVRQCASADCERSLNADNEIGYCREHRFLSPTRKEYNRDYYQGNQVELREYAAIYRQEHPEECRAASRAWAAANPERKARSSWRSAMFLKYGLTEDQHFQMWADQHGVCAICELAPKPERAGASAVLHVDHDHVTGRVRALLCGDCNSGLGRFLDDPTLMRRAADYVEYFGAKQQAS